MEDVKADRRRVTVLMRGPPWGGINLSGDPSYGAKEERRVNSLGSLYQM